MGKIIIEEKRIEMRWKGKQIIGYITLDKIAIPDTVKVTFLGDEIIPESFDCYGHPIFTEEQVKLCKYKEQINLKQFNSSSATITNAKIIYQEKILKVPRRDFDTLEGIQKSLTNLTCLNVMLNNRKRVISIEWQRNYKTFNLKKLFLSEDVTKWGRDGKYGIHAWTEEKAIEYLYKVFKNVTNEKE